MNNCVYILLCKNKRYYIGNTIDLEKRLLKHNAGLVLATKNLRPFSLIFCQEFSTIQEARKIEYWLKKLKNKELISRIISEGKIKKRF